MSNQSGHPPAKESGPPAIRVSGASKTFLGGAVTAFEALDLTVQPQEILCIVGPSGCGKTPLLRSIAGLTELTAGRIEVNGQKVVGASEGVAIVFQHFGLLPWKSVF